MDLSWFICPTSLVALVVLAFLPRLGSYSNRPGEIGKLSKTGIRGCIWISILGIIAIILTMFFLKGVFGQ